MRAASLIPILVFATVAAIMTSPAWMAATPHVVGELSGLDLAGSYWAHWWTADALGRGVNPFAATHSYHPTGLDPLLQYNLLDAIVHAPFGWALGAQAGYNAGCVAALTATGWAAFRLGQSAGVTASAAVLTGVLVEASSFVALELHCGRISQVVLVFMLLSLSRLLCMLKGDDRIGHAAITGILAAATALVYWYFGVALLVAGLVLLAGHRRHLDRAALRAVCTAAATGAVAIMPAVWELAAAWDSPPGIARSDAATIVQANSRAVVWPLINTRPLFDHQLSAVAVVLSAVAVWTRAPTWGSWTATAAAGWALALGPGESGLLPFGWLQRFVPGFDRMWWPYRFEVLAVVAVAVLAGLGLDALLRRRSRRSLWVAVAVLACTLDAPVRSGLLPLAASPLPPASASLYGDATGPILTVPIAPTAAETERLMLLQTHHGLPIPVGDGAHLPDHIPQAHSTWMTDNALLAALRTLHTTGSVTATVQPQDVAALIGNGFTHAVVDPSVFDAAQASGRAMAHARVFEAIWGDPIRRVGRGGTWVMGPIDESVTVSVAQPRGRDRARRRQP